MFNMDPSSETGQNLPIPRRRVLKKSRWRWSWRVMVCIALILTLLEGAWAVWESIHAFGTRRKTVVKGFDTLRLSLGSVMIVSSCVMATVLFSRFEVNSS